MWMLDDIRYNSFERIIITRSQKQCEERTVCKSGDQFESVFLSEVNSRRITYGSHFSRYLSNETDVFSLDDRYSSEIKCSLIHVPIQTIRIKASGMCACVSVHARGPFIFLGYSHVTPETLWRRRRRWRRWRRRQNSRCCWIVVSVRFFFIEEVCVQRRSDPPFGLDCFCKGTWRQN